MHRALATAVLLALLAGFAQAQEAGRLQLERPAAAELGLRGAPMRADPTSGLPQTNAPEAAPPILRPMASPPLLASLGAPPSAAQCRLDCAETYYFCLAGEESDECAQSWGQCRLGCGG
ncbi:MAG: hypothetical protein LPJ86_08050 [Caulobacteraceae bacterium]|nr:hypothetical protein [Caulobacteraceae bacterium]MDX5393761.1 hypothetical protein [Caulobacteraceae bacterium]